MSAVLDRLGELTGLRDRDTLDVSLAGALHDVLQPLRVDVLRRVGVPGDERWLLRARLAEGDATATSDPAWVEVEALPRCADHPLRAQALEAREPVIRPAPGGWHLAVFRLSTESGVPAVLELLTREPLDAAGQRLVGGILRIYRNFHSLLDDSERDTLTGLRNRKTFEERFAKLVAEAPAPERAESGTGSSWLGVIDIDHFKRVNDVHGHLIGDEVLLLLSRLLRSSFRFNDHVFRFGGEEFVVLMRCAGAEHAMQALERLRQRVQAYAFPRIGQATISIGFTEVRASDTPSDAFQRADQAVYWAKEHGRNRVCSFAELVRLGELNDEDLATGGIELF